MITFLVINNFSFLYMSWVFRPASCISSFYWKFKIISISNYNQHFIFKKTWEEFCRNFISYIWKSFELAVINMYCNIAMKSVPVAPRSEFPHKDGSEYILISFWFNRLLSDILQHLLNINKSSGTAQSSRDKTFCISTTCSLLSDSNCENRVTSVFHVTVSLFFLQRIGYSTPKNAFRSSLLEAFCKKGILKYFAIFTRKHLCRPEALKLY